MAGKNLSKFIGEVRQEMAKVTWPSRKETTASTVMVLIIVAITALFFLGVDAVVFNVIQAILGF